MTRVLCNCQCFEAFETLFVPKGGMYIPSSANVYSESNEVELKTLEVDCDFTRLHFYVEAHILERE